MTRKQQRREIEAAFAEALTTYRAARAIDSGITASEASHEGSLAFGKVMQTASLAQRMNIITTAEYEAYMDRITSDAAKGER